MPNINQFSPFKQVGSKIEPKIAGSSLKFAPLTATPLGLGLSDEGLSWYRSDLNAYFFWDGTTVLPLGGGSSSLQSSYDGGSDILLNANEPVQIRDNGIAYGNIQFGQIVDVNNASSVTQAINGSNPVNGIPNTISTNEVLPDTVVTITGPDQINFGTDLRALAFPPAIDGDTTNIINGNVVFLKDSNVAADEGIYQIDTLDVTGQIATVTNLGGGSPTFTSTTGTAKIGNFSRVDTGNVISGGVMHANFVLTGYGGPGIIGAADLNDNGELSTIRAIYNAGDVSDSLMSIINFSPAFGASADVPYLSFSQVGVAPDSVELKWAGRTGNPTTLLTRGQFYDDASISGITGRLKYVDNTSTVRTLATLDDVSGAVTLQDAYNNSSAPADITLAVTKDLRIVNSATSDFTLRNVGNTADILRSSNSGDGLYVQSQTANLAGLTIDAGLTTGHQLRLINGAPLGANAQDGTITYDVTGNRVYVGTGAGTEEQVAYLSDFDYVTVGPTLGQYIDVTSAFTAGERNVRIIENTTETSGITGITSDTYNIIINRGISWTLDDTQYTNVAGGCQINVSGEDAPTEDPTNDSAVIIDQDTLGQEIFDFLNAGAANTSYVNIKNLVIDYTPSTVGGGAFTNCNWQTYENFLWYMPGTGAGGIICANQPSPGYLKIKNGRMEGQATSATGVNVNVSHFAFHADISDLTFSGVWPAISSGAYMLYCTNTLSDKNCILTNITFSNNTSGAEAILAGCVVTSISSGVGVANLIHLENYTSLNDSNVLTANLDINGSLIHIDGIQAQSLGYTSGNLNTLSNSYITDQITIPNTGSGFELGISNTYLQNGLIINGQNNTVTGLRVGTGATIDLGLTSANNYVSGAIVDTTPTDIGTNNAITYVEY